jgi:hypothetical protein
MLIALNELVERRIEEAQREGAFENLPGAGRPLDLDDDRLVPEELRVAFRILKNAGFVPPELEALRGLDGLLDAAPSFEDANAEAGGAEGGSTDGRRAQRRMLALAMALERRGGSALTSGAGLEYRSALMRRLGGESAKRLEQGQPGQGQSKPEQTGRTR